MDTHEIGLTERAALEAMSVKRLLESSNAMLTAAYIGKRAKSTSDALAALSAMAELLEGSGPFCSRCAAELRQVISTATERSALECCRDAAQDLSKRGTEMTRLALERRSERRKWWSFWTENR